MPKRALLIVVLLLPLSLVITATTNHLVGEALQSAQPSLAWLATAAIPSFMVIFCLYMALGDRRALDWPSLDPQNMRSILRLSAIWLTLWLAGCTAFAVMTGHWIVYARGVPLVAAFLVFGPLGEELLFRGLIYERVQQVWPRSSLLPIAISSLAFSLHHIWLGAAPDGLAMAQLLFTLPMGIVFAATLSWSLTASRSKAAIRTPARPRQRKDAEQDSCLTGPPCRAAHAGRVCCGGRGCLLPNGPIPARTDNRLRLA